MSEHKYKLTYKIDRYPEGLTKQQLYELGNVSACDALLFASILYPEDGSLSVLFVGHDGRTDAVLDDIEWFKVWTMLTSRLAKSTTLSETKREFCQAVFETFRSAMMAARAAEDPLEGATRRQPGEADRDPDNYDKNDE